MNVATFRGPQVCALAGVTAETPSSDQLMAWAAGLYEGEGSIFWHTANNGPRMQLSSTDHDVLARFVDVVGVGRIYGPYVKAAPARLPRWDWQIGGHAKCCRLMTAFAPYLGERRRAKAVEVLGHEL